MPAPASSSSAALRVEVCENPASWDHYVESRPEAYSYHRWGWRQVIEEAFGHKPYYLSASADGELSGILPLFSVRSRLFGNSLVSVPFFTYAGVLADSVPVAQALLNEAEKLAQSLGVRHVELRQSRELDCTWHRSTSKVTMQVSLPATADELWKQFSTGLRNKIRKGQKSNFKIQWGGAEAIQDFYGVFAANMRNLGTPVYPRKWFEKICEHFPEQTHVMTISDEDRVVAGAFLSSYRETLELPWSASLPDTRKKYSHYLMYWTFLEWAIQRGFRRMDLGRCTPGSGTHEFKKHWVCEESPVDWYYWLAPGRDLPAANTSNPRYEMAIKLWKRLPLAVANRLGPMIVGGLP